MGVLLIILVLFWNWIKRKLPNRIVMSLEQPKMDVSQLRKKYSWKRFTNQTIDDNDYEYKFIRRLN